MKISDKIKKHQLKEELMVESMIKRDSVELYDNPALFIYELEAEVL